MLLPTKGISSDRALVTVGAEILSELDSPRSLSELWDSFNARRSQQQGSGYVTFDWFVLALSSVYALGAIEVSGSRLIRRTNVS